MACLKLFCCVGKDGTLIRILEVYNGSFGFETTQVEEFPIEPAVNFNSTRKTITDKKDYGKYVDSEESRCDNASLLHPCTDGERLGFIRVDEDSCCYLVVEKSQDCDEVGRATKSGRNCSKSFTVDGVEGNINISKTKIIYKPATGNIEGPPDIKIYRE